MKIYFAGAIRGGREKADTFAKIADELEKHGEILDKHVANPNVNELEANRPFEEIYQRDINWIKECDIVVAEVSTPSLGVGYEISYAEHLGKKIVCLCDETVRVSAMIGGNNKLELIRYKDDDDLILKLEKKFKNS